MLRTIRLTLAVIFFALITLLFLDFTGTLHAWFGWMAKIQFLPAVLALNIGVVLFLAVLTLVFGRIYCSVICPLGVFQDIVSWLSAKRKKNRFRYSPALKWLRYGNGESQEITPARLPEDTAERVRLLTSAIYDILGCSGLIRIDYIITEGEKVNLLEINTTPGMTATSFIPQQVRAAGLDIKDVMTDIIENKF